MSWPKVGVSWSQSSTALKGTFKAMSLQWKRVVLTHSLAKLVRRGLYVFAVSTGPHPMFSSIPSSQCPGPLLTETALVKVSDRPPVTEFGGHLSVHLSLHHSVAFKPVDHSFPSSPSSLPPSQTLLLSLSIDFHAEDWPLILAQPRGLSTPTSRRYFFLASGFQY